MPCGRLFGVGTGNSEILPTAAKRPILFPCASVNQIFPSGPTVTDSGALLGVGTVYRATFAPAGLARITGAAKSMIAASRRLHIPWLSRSITHLGGHASMRLLAHRRSRTHPPPVAHSAHWARGQRRHADNNKRHANHVNKDGSCGEVRRQGADGSGGFVRQSRSNRMDAAGPAPRLGFSYPGR